MRTAANGWPDSPNPAELIGITVEGPPLRHTVGFPQYEEIVRQLSHSLLEIAERHGIEVSRA